MDRKLVPNLDTAACLHKGLLCLMLLGIDRPTPTQSLLKRDVSSADTTGTGAVWQ